MSADPSIDAVLIQWGDRLFYPGNRIVKSHTPRLSFGTSRARVIRSRIEAAVRRAPQMMVKVTGGGRGMRAIAAHFRYITRNGRLEIEDDRGVVERGKDTLLDIERQWQFGGSCALCVTLPGGAGLRLRPVVLGSSSCWGAQRPFPTFRRLSRTRQPADSTRPRPAADVVV